MSQIQLSRYVRTRKRDGCIALFHQLNPIPTYCTLDTFRAITSGASCEPLNNDLLNRLTQTGVISSAHKDQETLVSTEELLRAKRAVPSILYLMVSQACNMECGYCPVPALSQRYSQTRMPPLVAAQGVRMWLREITKTYSAETHYYVIFYGGEPLLNIETITFTMELFADMRSRGEFLPANLHFMICTNGLLVTDEIARYCTHNNIEVAVGLDADVARFNGSRLDDLGQATFDRAVAALATLSRNATRLYASATITPGTSERLPEIAHFLANQGVLKMGFNFLKGKALVGLSETERREYFIRASRALIDLVPDWPRPDFEFQMHKKLTAFQKREWFPVGCTCYGNQIVVQADGRTSTCPFRKDAAHDAHVPIDLRSEYMMDGLALYGGECAWSNSECAPHGFTDEGGRIFAEEVLDELIWSELASSRVY